MSKASPARTSCATASTSAATIYSRDVKFLVVTDGQRRILLPKKKLLRSFEEAIDTISGYYPAIPRGSLAVRTDRLEECEGEMVELTHDSWIDVLPLITAVTVGPACVFRNRSSEALEKIMSMEPLPSPPSYSNSGDDVSSSQGLATPESPVMPPQRSAAPVPAPPLPVKVSPQSPVLSSSFSRSGPSSYSRLPFPPIVPPPSIPRRLAPTVSPKPEPTFPIFIACPNSDSRRMYVARDTPVRKLLSKVGEFLQMPAGEFVLVYQTMELKLVDTDDPVSMYGIGENATLQCVFRKPHADPRRKR